MTHGGAFVLRLIDRQAQSRAVARFHDLIALAIIAPLIAGRMSSALAVEKQSRAREKQLASVHGLGLVLANMTPMAASTAQGRPRGSPWD